MPILTIRKVDATVKERLRVRAARHGHSMEAQLRTILLEALRHDEDCAQDLAEVIRRRFAPFGGVDLPEHPPVAIKPRANFKR